MKTKFVFTFLLAVLSTGIVWGQEQKGQLDAFSVRTRDGSYHLQKQVPSQINPIIRGDGIPTKLFVVQLARFEDMAHIPSQFPEGTMLWQNPDIGNEKLLLAGFFSTYEDAVEAAKAWKQRKEFAKAFARKDPFMVLYN
ncbi:MAG: hypothetical protein SF052_01345 [Bacteroidia bacterium]|nr:hypothetical protein [Bacteroidia bacterium]